MKKIEVKNKTVDLPDGFYEVKKWSDRRSDRQNRYMWGVVVEVLYNTGQWETKQDVYDWIKCKFNGEQIEHNGETYIRGKSIAGVSKARFEEIAGEIRVWVWHNLEISIPAPNEVL